MGGFVNTGMLLSVDITLTLCWFDQGIWRLPSKQ